MSRTTARPARISGWYARTTIPRVQTTGSCQRACVCSRMRNLKAYAGISPALPSAGCTISRPTDGVIETSEHEDRRPLGGHLRDRLPRTDWVKHWRSGTVQRRAGWVGLRVPVAGDRREGGRVVFETEGTKLVNAGVD